MTHRIGELAETLAKLPQTFGQFDDKNDGLSPLEPEGTPDTESEQCESPLVSHHQTCGQMNKIEGEGESCPDKVFFTLKGVSFSTPCKNNELLSNMNVNFKSVKATASYFHLDFFFKNSFCSFFHITGWVKIL